MKVISPNYRGEIIFIEDVAVNPLNQNQKDAVIIPLNITPEISKSLDRIIIYFDLQPSFYLNAEDKQVSKRLIMDLKFNPQSLKHQCIFMNTQCNCELYREGSSIHILGYMSPREENGLRKFYFHGHFKLK